VSLHSDTNSSIINSKLKTFSKEDSCGLFSVATTGNFAAFICNGNLYRVFRSDYAYDFTAGEPLNYQRQINFVELHATSDSNIFLLSQKYMSRWDSPAFLDIYHEYDGFTRTDSLTIG